MKYKEARIFAVLFAGIGVAYIAWDAWVVRDQAALPRDIAFLVFSLFMLGLILWLGPRWKYYEKARTLGFASLAGSYGPGILAIELWTSGSRVSAIGMGVLCVWALIDMLDQVGKQSGDRDDVGDR